MSNNKILVAGVIGAIVALILGFLIYGLACSSYFASHTTEGIMRADADMVWWAMIVGHLTFGMLFAIIFGRWASISTFATGAKAGAVIGVLFALTFDLISFATSNIMDLTGALSDVVAMLVISAIVGGVVAWWLGRK
jgi:uncharacterized membrane protein YagU involved in acid resistance